MESIEKTEKLDHRHYIALLNNVKKRVDLAQQRLAATANVLGYWRNATCQPKIRRMGQQDLATAVDRHQK